MFTITLRAILESISNTRMNGHFGINLLQKKVLKSGLKKLCGEFQVPIGPISIRSFTQVQNKLTATTAAYYQKLDFGRNWLGSEVIL